MTRASLFLLWLCSLPAVLRADSLKEVMARMDAAASGFRGATANIRKISYTAVIKDSAEEKGKVTILRAKPREMQLRMDLTAPDTKTWVFRGKKAELYLPKINTVQEYDLGKYSRLLDQFLLLGFGSTSRDLQKSYAVKFAGEEVVDGQKASKLEMTPTSEQAREHLRRVEIWFPLSGGLPIQQKFFQNSGDYVMVSYSGLKLEANLAESAIRLALPKDVKREYPQK
ncbi:MAG: outer-membrane lipoprotein carrier protein LolA [Bryobacteraceae bacterium]|nr:outer-membrane lipoprotein carrier protein LolA [Bryobacteraceae bacterium]